MTKPSGPGFKISLAISFLLAVVLLWAPFLHLYLLNAGNLTLPLPVHSLWLGLLGLAIAGAALAIQLLVPSRWRTGVSASLLAGGIFFWAEGTLLIGHFGFFQGGDMDWDGNRYILYVEFLLAIFLVFLVLRHREQLIRKAVLVTALLVFSSLANLYGPFRTNQSRTRTLVRDTFTPEGLLELSPDRNVLLFIIDTFQTDVFAEILADDPGWKETLDGFTYFPNATSFFPKTYASIPNLLTGKAFDNSRPFPLYLKNAYLGHSLPRVLKKHGFDVRYHSFTWQPYYPHPDVVDNLSAISSAGGRQWMQRREFIQLANLVLFRLAPFLLKPLVYNDNQFLIPEGAVPEAAGGVPYRLEDKDRVYSRGNQDEDLEFLDQFRAFVSAGRDRPAFRVFHLLGVHEPLLLDRDLNYIGKQAETRPAFRNQAEGMLKLLSLALEKLKETGTYDNSLIIVVGDHGGSGFSSLGIRKDLLPGLGLDMDLAGHEGPVEEYIRQCGLPLVLVKRVGASGPLAVSGAPVELADLTATVCTELGFTGDADRPSMFDIAENAERVRIHRYYRFAGWGQDYIVPMTEFRISGFSWDPAAWTPTGRDLNRQAVESVEGELVVLGQGGNLEDFAHDGWSVPDIQGRRIQDRAASITIPHRSHPGDTSLEVVMRHILSPEKPVPLTIFVNGERIDRWLISRRSPIKMWTFVPEKFCRDSSNLEIRFEFPQELGADPLFVEVRLSGERRRRSYSLGQTILFTSKGNADAYLGPGWRVPEDWGTWSNSTNATVHMALDEVPDRDLEVEIRFLPAVFENSPPLEIEVQANGKSLAGWSFTTKGWKTKSFILPRSLVGGNGTLDFDFFIADPRAPSEYESHDTRELGLGLSELVIR